MSAQIISLDELRSARATRQSEMLAYRLRSDLRGRIERIYGTRQAVVHSVVAYDYGVRMRALRLADADLTELGVQKLTDRATIYKMRREAGTVASLEYLYRVLDHWSSIELWESSVDVAEKLPRHGRLRLAYHLKFHLEKCTLEELEALDSRIHELRLVRAPSVIMLQKACLLVEIARLREKFWNERH